MKWLRTLLVKLTCRVRGHNLRLVRSKITGVTLSWAADATREYGFDYVCDRCGRTVFKGGYVVPGDRKLHPEEYDDNGWPLDINGEKMQVGKRYEQSPSARRNMVRFPRR